MTAAAHFLAGEKLLAEAEKAPDSRAEGLAARASAHFRAAGLLLKADEIRHPDAALGRSGFDRVIDARFRASSNRDGA